MSLRILYAGSPEPSAAVLEHLLSIQNEVGFELVGVLTNPPSAQKRHKTLIPTAVATVAEKNGIKVFTPIHLDSECRAQISEVKADLLVCFDYGHIFGPKFLAMFPLGGINLHPSLLPKYRGCTPVPAAILAGDKETGISLQTLALKTDEGDLLAQEKIQLSGKETTESMMACDGIVVTKGKNMLEKAITEIVATKNDNGYSLPHLTPQKGEASYTPFISRDDGKIDWNKSAVEIERMIRAYTPWPNCHTVSNNVVLKILEAHVIEASDESAEVGTVLSFDKADGIHIKTGNGVLSVTKLQWQAKNAVDYKSFMNGARSFIGSVLG